MAFQSVPNTASVHFRGTLFDQNIENVIYVSAGNPYTQGDIDDIAEIANDAWQTYMMPNLTADYTYRETYVKGLENIIDLEATDATNSGDPGTAAGTSAPGNVAFAVKFQTGHTGRSARGRNYVTAITEGVIVGNQVTAAYANGVRDAYISIGTALNAGGYPQQVVSRYSGGAKRAVGVTNQVTVISYTDLNIDSQRNRLTGRGS